METTHRENWSQGLGTYIRTYSVYKSNHLSANIKLIVYRELIRSIMTYACPTREFAEDTHLMKLQRSQNRILRDIGKFGRCTPVRDLHLACMII
jgi:urease accessory protein UreF